MTPEESLSREQLLAELRRVKAQRDLAQTLAEVGTWEWDLRTNRMTLSDELFRILGLPPSPTYSLQDYRQHVPADDLEALSQAMAAARTRAGTLDVECRLLRPDGDLRHVLIRGKVQLDDEGAPAWLSGIVQDLTSRRRAEEALRESETRYRLVADHVDEIISVTSPAGKPLYFSPAVTRMLGYALEEVSGDRYVPLLHPDDVPRYQALRERMVAGEDQLRWTFRARHKDGHYLWLESNVRKLYDPQTGELQGHLGVSRDVTTHKEAEAQLHRMRVLLEEAQRLGHMGSFEADLQNGVVAWSDTMYRLFDVDPATFDPSAEAIWARIHPDDRARSMAIHARVSARPEPFVDEYRVVRRDGEVRHLYTRGEFELDEAGRPRRMVGIAQDVTERQLFEATLKAQNERLHELNRLQTNFVHSVSHELRTPLTSIVGYAEFLEDSLVAPEHELLQDYVHQIQLSTRRLQRLLDDLLDFALIEAGTFTLKPEPTDLAHKIHEIAESFRPQVAQAGLQLEVSLPDGPIAFTADPQRVGQVLTNFIGNAVKMTPAGGRIEVRAQRVAEQLRVEVADTGPGISPDDLPRLFHRFSQLESGVRRGGAGLGLSISKGLVEAHGGTVGVDSAPGHGSTFWFTLPWPAEA